MFNHSRRPLRSVKRRFEERTDRCLRGFGRRNGSRSCLLVFYRGVAQVRFDVVVERGIAVSAQFALGDQGKRMHADILDRGAIRRAASFQPSDLRHEMIDPPPLIPRIA